MRVVDVLGVAKKKVGCSGMEIGPRASLCSSGAVSRGLVWALGVLLVANKEMG